MTKQMKFNNTIIQSESLLFRTLWNSTNDNMFIIKKTNEGEFINEKSNKSLHQTFNLEENTLNNTSLKELLDEDTYKRIKEKYNYCIEINTPISYEEVHVIEEVRRYWDTTIVPIYDFIEDTTRIFGISREVTQLKRDYEALEVKVRKRTQELEKALEDIQKISITDKLTNIFNRRHLDNTLDNAYEFSKRYGSIYGVILLDIDNFKQVNDTYGHHIGDKVLQEFANLLKKSIRTTDTLGRWGGEEFMIIVPEAQEESIMKFANILREKIQNHNFPSINKLTSSIGVSLSNKDDTTESFIIRADIALYKAKSKGKNRVDIEM